MWGFGGVFSSRLRTASRLSSSEGLSVMFSILDDIEALDDGVAIYALVGLCISEAAEIEWFLFECYLKASGMELGDAIAVFYKFVKFAWKRDKADAALKAYLSGKRLAEWNELLQQIQEVCGPDGARNLVGHNPPRYSIYAVDTGDSEKLLTADVIEVSQNENLVMAGLRPARTETRETLSGHARKLRAVHRDLMSFWHKLIVDSEARG